MTAWADYVDARLQLVHHWRHEGASLDDIASRLTIDVERIAVWLKSEPLPFPGSSRSQLAEWKARVAALEAELHAAGAMPSEPPKESEFRALRTHPDAELCGCQYWTDHPRPGMHHSLCEHASRPSVIE